MIAILIDLVFVIGTMTAIATGETVEHIPFWDFQIKLLLSILA